MSKQKKALTLTVPEPCGENFNTMTPIKGGKFCGSCEKTIVDFRTMSDGQILNFYKNSNGKICGVFDEVQLNRAMPFPMEIKPNRNWKAVAALAAGLMFSGGLSGQNTSAKVEKPTVIEQQIVKGEVVNEKEEQPNSVLKGRVLDGEEGLIGANVLIKGTSIGTTTDIDGNFELVIPHTLTDFEVEVEYLGFETQTLLFNDKYPLPNKSIAIQLSPTHPMMGEMIMGIVIAYDELEQAPVCETKIEEESVIEIAPDVQAKNVPTEKQMTIYPNPFVDDFKVAYEFEAKGDYLFHLYDTNGRLLFAKSYQLSKGTQTVQLDVATQNLVDGVYILQISDKKDRILATKKVYKGQA